MESKTRGYACPRCTVGRCLPRLTTFTEIYQDQLLCAPNMRAYICDVCHFAEFEQETLEALWQELYGDAPVDEYQAVGGRRGSTYGGGSS